jgi:hypothetical protein
MPSKSSSSDTARSPKPDLTEHEDAAVPFDDVLRQLLSAKPAVKPSEPTPAPPVPPSDDD